MDQASRNHLDDDRFLGGHRPEPLMEVDHPPPSTEVSENPDNVEDTNNSATEDDDDEESFLNGVLYSMASFHAVITPVSITMILSALLVVYINTDALRERNAETYSNLYETFDLDDGNDRRNLGLSIANTLIIVGVVCSMTFVVVLLYKYRCMKCLVGYMVLVTAVLLGYFSSLLWQLAMSIYGLNVDKFTFAMVLYNFAAVGTYSIFYPKGVPRWTTQGYLIASSSILAWQLSFFQDWTAWTLLIMLALYDLFAVLAPCGPLKALVKQMSRPDAPELPSLLYEAQLPTNVRKPRGRRNPNRGTLGRNDNEDSEVRASVHQSQQFGASSFLAPASANGISTETSTRSHAKESSVRKRSRSRGSESSPVEEEKEEVCEESTPAKNEQRTAGGQGESQRIVHADGAHQADSSIENGPGEPKLRGQVALAVAKLYRLTVYDEAGALTESRGLLGRRRAGIPQTYTPDEIRARKWTPRQLQTEVTVEFPPRGGRIESREPRKVGEGRLYVVFKANGAISRKFTINDKGELFQIVEKSNGASTNSERSNTIKLGIGDFIFYSLLVSKAGLYSFTAFVVCMEVILFGLGVTLILLAVYGKALPALPVSIILGVIFFLLTRQFIEPWIHDVFQEAVYV